MKGLLALSMLCVFLAACAKQQTVVGRENPGQEIQKCIKLSEKKRFKEAIECMEVFKSHFPTSEWGVEAELYIGDNYFREKEYLLAADSYQSFIKLHPTHPKVDYAYYKTGLSYLRHTPKAIDRDQEYLGSALANFEIVRNNFPGSAYLEVNNEKLLETRKKMALKDMYIGRFYYRTGEYIASIPRFKNVSDNYRDTGLAEKALYYITLANLKLKRLEGAKESFSQLSIYYPNSRYIKDLEKKLISAASEK